MKSQYSAVTVYIVDDNSAVCEALSELLRHHGYCVQTYTDVSDYLAVARPCDRGCLILDVRMPTMSGLALLEQAERYPLKLPVIILTAYADVPMVVRAFKLGVLDFLEKPVDEEVLLAAVNRAIDQDNQLHRQREHQQLIAQRLAALTEREQAVLERLVAGDSHKMIAARLNISLSTVEVHRKHIQEKLQADHLADLVRIVAAARADAGV